MIDDDVYAISNIQVWFEHNTLEGSCGILKQKHDFVVDLNSQERFVYVIPVAL